MGAGRLRATDGGERLTALASGAWELESIVLPPPAIVRRQSAQETRAFVRYITRPAIANERLALNRAGQVVLTLN